MSTKLSENPPERFGTPVDDQTLAQALGHYHDQFVQALQGVAALAECRLFAHILLCRLLLIYDLQTAGYLGQGDRWYLHNQLGRHAQTHQGSFFQSFLQPLCHQGFSLPIAERPLALSQSFGDIPYLGNRLFLHQTLEQRYTIDLPDEPIEQFLGWLAEQTWQRQTLAHSQEASQPEAIGAITRQILAQAWEILLTETSDKSTVMASEESVSLCRQTVDAHLLQALSEAMPSAQSELPDVLAGLTDDVCQRLVTNVLPGLSMLDPACGSGSFLLMTLERLQWVYQTCWDYAQASADPHLQAWVRSLQSQPGSPQWVWTQQVMTQTLHGIDARSEAIVVTQTQLWLRLLATLPSGKQLPLLPDLDFNIVEGNALIGFIRVDEERFDQVRPKRSATEKNSEPVLQGNLLQPLAASSYRDTLAERQIRIEHYRAQTQAMGTEGGIPEYAQREFLRDRIETVNAAAQQKLNDLLFETLSRQLSIVVKEPQASGRARKRLLTPADVTALQPLHWGFSFHKIIAQGGFDLVITQAPEGTLRPRADEFYRLYQERFEQVGIPLTAFRRSRRRILQQHPDIAARWSTYAGLINCLRDYVRRSEDFTALNPFATQRAITLKQLFKQRCTALTKTGAAAVYIK